MGIGLFGLDLAVGSILGKSRENRFHFMYRCTGYLADNKIERFSYSDDSVCNIMVLDVRKRWLK